MKKWKTPFAILIGFLMIFSTIACHDDDDWWWWKGAEIELYGGLTKGYTSYDRPYVGGTVINNGDETGYNTKVTIHAYRGNTIVDTAYGYPANLGDIPEGVTATFEAVFYYIESHDDYDRLEIDIDYLTRW